MNFRLNVGNILDDWNRLRIIYFLLFGLYFFPNFFLAVTGEHFWWILCNKMEIMLFCHFDCLSRFTHFGEHFWPALLDRGTPQHFFQLCLYCNCCKVQCNENFICISLSSGLKVFTKLCPQNSSLKILWPYTKNSKLSNIAQRHFVVRGAGNRLF